METDYLIVGSGLTGSVMARQLADAGRKVLVLERRGHLGGNVFDYVHPCGIRVHKYGPHYFRTSSDEIWAFINRFSSFYKFEAVVKAYVDGRYENWPIAAEYIKRTVGEDWRPSFQGIPRNFEERSLSMMPKVIYEKFVKEYTRKQWGVPGNALSPDLAKRFDVRLDNDPRLMLHKYQGLPELGYSGLVKNILSGIDVLLGHDYLQNREAVKCRKMLIYTGPIDAFFEYKFGKLTYRGQKRKDVYLKDVEWYQDCPQVNYPSELPPHLRTIEWKHMMQKSSVELPRGTIITEETTQDAADIDNFEYPVPDEKNRTKYELYKKRAESIPDLLICGRLGEYRYYDMDHAIERALELAARILEGE